MTSIELEDCGAVYGAVYEKNEDRFGDTKTGWWLDGVYLGETARDVMEAIKG